MDSQSMLQRKDLYNDPSHKPHKEQTRRNNDRDQPAQQI